MNDRFKYRVWDSDAKRMIHSDEYRLSSNGVLYVINGNAGWWPALDNHAIMQCTGLKDKNGTLIYEGDVVEVQYGDPENELYREEIRDIRKDLMFDSDVSYLVVGNRYENPELLEYSQ